MLGILNFEKFLTERCCFEAPMFGNLSFEKLMVRHCCVEAPMHENLNFENLLARRYCSEAPMLEKLLARCCYSKMPMFGIGICANDLITCTFSRKNN